MAKESKSPSDIGDVPITLKNSIEDQSLGKKSDINDTINHTIDESKIFDSMASRKPSKIAGRNRKSRPKIPNCN